MEDLTYIERVRLLVHRALAGHSPREECLDCPFVACRHCGNIGKPGEDHSCPCPYPDETCLDHPKMER